MAYLDGSNDKDLIYLGSGFLITGILLIGVPVCIPKQHPLASICKIGSSILAISAFGTAGYCWRRWHKVVVPDIRLQQAIFNQEREELLLNESEERVTVAIAASIDESTGPTPNGIKTVTAPEQLAAQPTQQQLERLFYEGSDEVRNWLRQNGFFSPKNGPEPSPDKAFSDSEKPGSSGNAGKDQLADSAPAASPSSPLPEWGEEKLRDGQKWNYPEAARRIRYLVAGGLTVEKAILFLTGATSGTVYQSLLTAYRKLE